MGYEPPIRWDIVEEHLDEAAFLHQLWEESLRSPKYALWEIAEGPEERMLAHLDGLVLGGAQVATKLLVPALRSDEPGVSFASAFALLASEDGDFVPTVLEALARAEPEQQAALRRAMEVVPVVELERRWVALAAERSPLQADLVLVLAARGVDPGQALDGLAASSDPGVRARALELAPRVPGRVSMARVEAALSSADEPVRSAALTTGVLVRARNASAVALDTVKRLGPGFGAAGALLAVSGDEPAVPALIAALSQPARAAEAAFALGFTGRAAAVEALLSVLDDEKLSPLAAEGISAIAGLPIEKELSRRPKRWDPEVDGEEDEPFGPEADLPRPEPAAVRGWWKAHGPKLDRRGRFLGGQPSSPLQLVRALESGPARRRGWLAVELALRTSRPHVVTVNALTWLQRKQLAALARGTGPTARPVGASSGGSR